MDNKESIVVKNKPLKKFLCYFGLIILVILLFIPMAFRIIFKEKKIDNGKEVVTTLNCSKGIESIRSNFLNDEPLLVIYSIDGIYNKPSSNKVENNVENTEENTESNSEENNEIGNVEEIYNNAIIKKFSSYGSFEYDEENNKSTMRFNADYAKGSLDYEIIFSTVDTQKKYYEQEGFTCTVTKDEFK